MASIIRDGAACHRASVAALPSARCALPLLGVFAPAPQPFIALRAIDLPVCAQRVALWSRVICWSETTDPTALVGHARCAATAGDACAESALDDQTRLTIVHSSPALANPLRCAGPRAAPRLLLTQARGCASGVNVEPTMDRSGLLCGLADSPRCSEFAGPCSITTAAQFVS